MIKAEIITDASVYRLEIVGIDSLEEAYKYVSEKLLHTDEAVFFNLHSILAIDLINSAVKSYRVWQEQPNPLEHLAAIHPAPEIQAPPTEPWAFKRPVQFLGRKIGLEALAYELNGQRFVMPMALDGRAPHDALNEASLHQLLAVNFPEAAAVIPPPVTLTATESYAFLVDYAEAAAPEMQIGGEVNARAARRVFE
jgi:hypothetical protein